MVSMQQAQCVSVAALSCCRVVESAAFPWMAFKVTQLHTNVPLSLFATGAELRSSGAAWSCRTSWQRLTGVSCLFAALRARKVNVSGN